MLGPRLALGGALHQAFRLTWRAGLRTGGAAVSLPGGAVGRRTLEERLEQVEREGEDDRGALLGADLQQRLQVAQLQRGRFAADACRGARELLRGRQLGQLAAVGDRLLAQAVPRRRLGEEPRVMADRPAVRLRWPNTDPYSMSPLCRKTC